VKERAPGPEGPHLELPVRQPVRPLLHMGGEVQGMGENGNCRRVSSSLFIFASFSTSSLFVSHYVAGSRFSLALFEVRM